MHISDLISLNRIECVESSSSKKKVLEKISQIFAADDISATPNEIFDCLVGREKLGSTGIGHGVAIPHGRIHDDHNTRAVFVKLQQGVEYDAIDEKPVDLIFALLVPQHSTNEHLEILAILARMFSDEELCRTIRESENADDIYTTLSQWQT